MEKPNLAEETRHLSHNIASLIKQQGITRSFFRGVAAGLGSVVGATIVVAILALVLRNIQLIPVIGDWVAQIVEYVKASTGI